MNMEQEAIPSFMMPEHLKAICPDAPLSGQAGRQEWLPVFNQSVKPTIYVTPTIMKKMYLLLFVLIFSITGRLKAQDEAQEAGTAPSPFDIGADVVSRYVWRGLELSSAPAIQPWISYGVSLGEKSELEIGAWGSYSFEGLSDGSEADLYATLSAGIFSFTITDYFFPADRDDTQNYFDFGNHTFEGMVGVEKNGFSASFGYYFAGNAAADDIYVELGYTINDVDIFIGGGDKSYTRTISETGQMEDGDFDLTNIGLTYNKEIKSIPVFGTLLFNPDAEKIHIVFGASF